MGNLVLVLALLIAACASSASTTATTASAAPATPPAPALASTQEPAPDIAAERTRQQGAYARLIASGGRYMENGCAAPQLDFARYENLPVITCTYVSLGVTARVSMLNPSAEQLAAWTVSACQDIHATELTACGDAVRQHIWGASNAQFPVAGFVIEPAQAVGANAPRDTPYCILFRDGVSVRTASFSTRAFAAGETCGPDSANAEPLRSALRFARIASTNRAMYKAAGGAEDVDASGEFSPQWAAVVGRLWREAWASDRNFLIYAWAFDAISNGAIR